MVNEALQKVFGWSIGHLLNEGYEVKCAGIAGVDANGMPIVSDRHLICTLGSHLPGAQAHAVGNAEFDDSLWQIDSAQTSIDWSNPKCCICQRELSP